MFGRGKIDKDLYEELETVLLTSDMGVEATEKLLAQVRQRVILKGLKNSNELRSALKKALYELLLSLQQPLILLTDKKPFVIKMAGVNGASKTTSIGKNWPNTIKAKVKAYYWPLVILSVRLRANNSSNGVSVITLP